MYLKFEKLGHQLSSFRLEFYNFNFPFVRFWLLDERGRSGAWNIFGAFPDTNWRLSWRRLWIFEQRKTAKELDTVYWWWSWNTYSDSSKDLQRTNEISNLRQLFYTNWFVHDILFALANLFISDLTKMYVNSSYLQNHTTWFSSKQVDSVEKWHLKNRVLSVKVTWSLNKWKETLLKMSKITRQHFYNTLEISPI